MLPVGYIFLFIQGMGLDNDVLMKIGPNIVRSIGLTRFSFKCDQIESCQLQRCNVLLSHVSPRFKYTEQAYFISSLFFHSCLCLSSPIYMSCLQETNEIHMQKFLKTCLHG